MIYKENWTREEFIDLRKVCEEFAEFTGDEDPRWRASAKQLNWKKFWQYLADACEFSRMTFEQREFELWKEEHHGTTECI